LNRDGYKRKEDATQSLRGRSNEKKRIPKKKECLSAEVGNTRGGALDLSQKKEEKVTERGGTRGGRGI